MSAAGDRTPVTAERRAHALGVAVPAAFAGLMLCWILADPAGPAASSMPSLVGLLAGVVLVGLGCLPMLGVQPALTAIAGFAVVWLIADIVTIWFDVASRVGVSVGRVSVGQFIDGATSTPGELISIIAAMVIVAWTLTARRPDDVALPVSVVGALAALGIAAPAVAGHAVTHPVEPILIVAHALCAAWWCGSLAAMAMTISGRDGWRTALPVFSKYAVYVVGLLAVTGLASGAIELGIGSLWWTTGYGLVMLAKAVVLAMLVGLGARHRRRWVPDVVARRGSSETSLRAAVIEVVVMSVVLGLAAGLATTSPVG
ncbi:copper resistance protein CopD [Gordonia sp. TBRC 11910]|uniref:Copper resistance protein CopD n=1 Tax=Gordonia asplenii TaxID=2725283 RepID=A0A848L2S0_9ACTN|nr:CopD family protein [Gordonia asplenii]NMO05029.1 copper resistance protein CopD [Gordonia asplenii]